MEKFARKDSITGEGMNEGFCFGDGEFYCKSDENALEHAKSIGYKDLEESYKDGSHYWTEWYQDIEDEENLEEWYDAKGNKFTKRDLVNVTQKF